MKPKRLSHSKQPSNSICLLFLMKLTGIEFSFRQYIQYHTQASVHLFISLIQRPSAKFQIINLT